MTSGPAWWQRGAIYQIYPRSFADSDGDGIGDLPGITERLDHIEALGAEAIWLSPFYRSPMADFGYDVADYRDVDPVFGTLADFDALLEAAHRPRHPRGRRLGAEPQLGPARVVPRVAVVAREPAPRLVRLARRRRQRRAAERLAVRVPGRRPRVDVRRGDRAVVPALVHGRAARPQLGQPRGRGGDARHAALLAGPRGRRLPGRRAPAAGARPAPALERGRRAPPRPGLGDDARAPARYPPRGRRVRGPDARRRGGDRRPAPRRHVPQRRRPAAPRAQLRLRRPGLERRGVRARRSPTSRRSRAASPGPRGSWATTTCRASRRASTAAAASARRGRARCC